LTVGERLIGRYKRFPPGKDTPMTVFLLTFGLVSVSAIAGTIVTVARDGYRRVPERTFNLV
jgi:hypothetical protein